MARQPGAGCGAERLDGVALVEEPLVIEHLQQEPQRLDILVLKGDIGVFQIHPIAHLLGQFIPKVFVLQYLGAAGLVILVHTNLLADILLGNAQLFLHAQFHRQSVGVPACLAVHIVTLLCLVAAEHVLNGACHHMVDARLAVGRRRTVVEHV